LSFLLQIAQRYDYYNLNNFTDLICQRQDIITLFQSLKTHNFWQLLRMHSKSSHTTAIEILAVADITGDDND